ncbi:MAG: adenylate/guanylate cyclase domain-containing protein [Phyllobacteriaceae bacterium]|nr:adenylate/guanylate cyclase domain-containing protein [Phyllobacteriaceae bacterium]
MGRRGWIAVLFGLAIIIALTLLRAADPYAVRVARETTFDLFQQIKPREAPPGLPIRIIDIDEPSLRSLGQWPWSRTMMAEIAQRLTDLGAAAIAFDLLFSEPDRLGEENDAAFAQTIASAPVILSFAQSPRADETTLAPKAGVASVGENPLASVPKLGGVAEPLKMLADPAQGLAIASLDRDGSGVARRLPLLWQAGDATFPALAIEALRVAMGASTIVAMGSASPGMELLRVVDFSIPTGPGGDHWIYYRELDPGIYLPARELMADDYADLAPLIEGHIVLIGTSASGLLDIRTSALGTAVPGVSIHAQIIEQVLTNTFLDRADWVAGLEALLFIGAGLLVILAVILTGPIIGLFVSLSAVAVLVASAWYAFAVHGLLIDPSFSLLGILVLYAAMAFFRFASTDADRRRVRRAFAHYVEPSLLTRIEADANLLKLGGDMRELTVMFSDVRNFSALAERTAPTDLVAILNRLFAALGAAIVKELGTIDKFMGDAVMAFWNAPAEVDRHALHACRAALGMRAAVEKLSEEGREPIAIGIGIATGPALVGNMGFEQRFDYSCIGDTVNVASRIEGACKTVAYDILVTRPTADAAPELAYLEAGALQLKGMTDRDPILILVGDETLARSADFAALAQAHADLLRALSQQDDFTALLETCRSRAGKIDHRLIRFYDACPARPADFRLLEPEEA